MAAPKVAMPPKPDFKRGDRVEVFELGIAAWMGTVNAVKPSKESGWWVDVDRDGVGIWSICLQTTRVEVLSTERDKEVSR
jgi:hypothetical protein